MTNYDRDRESYDFDDDDRFYEETVYNEEYYIELEHELIRQSNLELELEELEERHIREMWKEGLLRPTLVKTGENKPGKSAPAPVDPGEFPF
jgi:hypothetical protein